MNKEERNAFLALPVVLLIAVGFIIVIGSDQWSRVDWSQSLYPVALAFLLQWIAFVPSYVYKTEHYYDLVGGASFVCVAGLCMLLAPIHNVRSIVLFTMVVLWAGRLSIFLFIRVRRSGKDGRFDEIKKSLPRFLFAWTAQGLWITFTLAPVMAVILSKQFVEPGVFFILGRARFLLAIKKEVCQ